MRGLELYHWSLETPGNKEFVKAFEERWGNKPGFPGADGWNYSQIVFEAIKNLLSEEEKPKRKIGF